MYISGLYGSSLTIFASKFKSIINFSNCWVNANWSYPSAIIEGRCLRIVLYLSDFSPSSTRSVQPVFSRFLTRIFSELSGFFFLICFTVLSLATIATINGFVKRFARDFACIKRFS